MLKVIVIFFGLLLALWENIAVANESNPLPTFIVENSVEVMEYDGHTLRDAHLDESPSFSGYPDDLLSGGLNTVGLQSTTPPSFADPLNPTATELRRYAFYTYFRSNIDITTEGGFGLFWGPDLAPDFGPDIEHGLIPGVEYTASMQVSERSGNIHRIPVAIQIPDHFDLKNPCIFLASSPESQGYYGGIAIGEWGLLKGCAVVLPGKGTGTGFHDLSSDKVYTADGVLTSATFSNAKIQFAVEKNGQLKEFTKKHPHRVATKHAHSQINCERIWGDLALNGIEFAFWALNDWFGQIMTTAEKVNNQSKKLDEICYPLEDEYTPENTLVIAAGISDGGGAALRALENDTKGLIDGLVVSQPNINPDSANKFEIKIGTKRFNGHGTSFFENSTLMGIYAPCAALSLSLQNTPCNVDPIGAPEGARVNRCQALYSIGLLKADTILDQAEEALDILRAHGYEQAQEILLAGYEWLNIWRSLNPAYAAALGRFAVWENIGGISFG
ncbi:MAG: 3-hydroxybutyrate oligomer hydrolase family protein, partial [Desulfobacteraceae bacterium]